MMNTQTVEGTVDRPLRQGEVRIFGEENFGGEKQILTAGEAPAFPVAAIQLGPQTGVTLFSGADCTGLSQELMADLASFAQSRLQVKQAASLGIWPIAQKPYGGYWAIEVQPGRYLTVGLGGVLTTSECVTELATFRIQAAGPAQGVVALTPRQVLPKVPPTKETPGGFLTTADLQKVALKNEPGKRRYSLLSADNRYIAYSEAENRFTLTSSYAARAMFGNAVRIADDETQLAPLVQGEVALFENPAYWGKTWVFDTDYTDFGKVTDLSVSSIQIGPRTGATIYRTANLNQLDPKAPKQDVTSNLPALTNEQVRGHEITSMTVWLIVPPQGQGVTFTSKLSQDFRGAGSSFQEFSAYRTTLRLPLLVQNVEVWATDETDITVNNVSYHVSEDQSITVPPNELGRLVITSDALHAAPGEPARDGLNAPGIKIRTDAMPVDQRIVIYPDREVHQRLATLEPGALWNASFMDNNGKQHPLIRDRSLKNPADIAAAQSMITRLMSTVTYSSGAGGHDQSVSGAGLGGKSWALYFDTCRVTVRTLFVREGPGLHFEKKGYFKRSDMVKILGFNVAGDWIHVQRLSDGLEGWSYGMFLGKIGGKATEEAQYRVKASVLNMRQGPDTTFPIVGALKKGTAVIAFGVNDLGDWRWVCSEDGKTGWCSARYLELVPTQDISFAIDTAPAAEMPNPQPPAIPGLTPNVRFREASETEVQALLARTGSAGEELSFGLFSDGVKWITGSSKTVFNGIKSGVSFVVTMVGDAIGVLIDLGKEVVGFLIDTVQKVVAFVEGILEKIGALIEDVIKWLRLVFNWDDILQTRSYIRRNTLKALDYLGNTLAKEAQTPVKQYFAEQRQAISRQFDRAIQELGGAKSKPSSQTPSFLDDGLEAIDWLMSKINPGGLQSSFLTIPYPSDANEKLLPFWKDFLMNVANIFIAGPQGFDSIIGSLVRDPDKPQLAVAELLRMFQRQVIGVLDLGEDIVVGLLKLASYLVEQVTKIITADLRLPFISDLIEWIGKQFGKDVNASLGFSILDAITLIVAIPVTIISKVTLGRAPFADVSDFALPVKPWARPVQARLMNTHLSDDSIFAFNLDAQTQGPVVDGFTITAGVTGYLTALLSIPLDICPEGMEQNTGALEILTFACNIITFGFDQIPNIVSIKDGKDREGSETDWLWWSLFGYDALVIGLDSISLVVGGVMKGNPERLRRNEKYTICLSSVLGLIYIAFVIAKMKKDGNQFPEGLTDCLMVLPDVCAPLRLTKNPYASLAYGLIDVIAGTTAFVKGGTGW
jgi:uncharacterized protein YgiM (DUF1202 family)